MKLADLISDSIKKEIKYFVTGLQCPICKSNKSRVVDKADRILNCIYRRRECENKHRFTTLEKVNTAYTTKEKPAVMKKRGDVIKGIDNSDNVNKPDGDQI